VGEEVSFLEEGGPVGDGESVLGDEVDGKKVNGNEDDGKGDLKLSFGN